MGDIFTTMIPIFSIIFLGVLARHIGFINYDFLESAHRLVFYIAIPAIIFHSTCCSSIIEHYNVLVVWISIFSIMVLFVFCRLICAISNVPTDLIGSVSQCSIHGNLGYIGLAVIFYYLGSEGIAQSSVIMAFIMIFQNFVSILGFQTQSGIKLKNIFSISAIAKLVVNPVIISSVLGILFSLSGLILPRIIDKILDILSGFALPLALLIIGASLSIDQIRKWFFVVFVVCISKLVLLPLLAIVLFRYYEINSYGYMPAIILLSSPTATISCVMAQEMGGNAEFSATAVSLSTLLSIFTFSIWLKIGVL